MGIISNKYFIAAASLAIYICLVLAQEGPTPEKITVVDIAEHPENFLGRIVIVSGTIYYQNESDPTGGYYLEEEGRRINVCTATKLERNCTQYDWERCFQKNYTKIDFIKSGIGKPIMTSGRVREIDDDNGKRYELCWQGQEGN